MAQPNEQQHQANLTAREARLAYQHRMQQRQTVVFSTIGIVMAALLVISTFFLVSGIPFPFNKPFSQDPHTMTVAPCPAGSEPLSSDKITVRIYNSGSIEGLAGKVGKTLTDSGMKVDDTANWGGNKVVEAVRIYTGKDGVDAAYTLRAYFPNANVVYDSSNTSAVVDVVLGAGWKSMIDAPTDDDFTTAMKPINECVAPSEL